MESIIHRPNAREYKDRGAVLVIAFILVIVMGMIAVGIARFAATGLATSEVTDERMQGSADAAGAMYHALDQLTRKRYVACSYAHDGIDYSVPSGPPPDVVPNGSTVTYSCSSLGPAASTGHPTFQISAHAMHPSGYDTTVTVVVQVPNDEYVVQIDSWEEL